MHSNKTPEILTTKAAFGEACAGLSNNETAIRFNHDIPGQQKIVDALKDMGLTKFVNLTSKSNEGTIALSLYAGDGIVVKIIPQTYLNNTDAIHHLPAISTQDVKTDNYEYAIKTYPWVEQGYVTDNSVETLRDTLETLGLKFIDGDDTAQNIHRMPDQNGTFVGIDSSMYHAIKGRPDISEEQYSAWHEYVHTLFPIYPQGSVPAQTDNTDFSFFSIHDKEAKLIGFDSSLDDPIIRTQEPEPKKTFWRSMFSSSNDDNTHPAPF